MKIRLDDTCFRSIHTTNTLKHKPDLSTASLRWQRTSILRRSADPIKILIGSKGDLTDRLLTCMLIAEVTRHHADHEWTIRDKYNPRIVAHAFELAGLVGDYELRRKELGDATVFGCREYFE